MEKEELMKVLEEQRLEIEKLKKSRKSLTIGLLVNDVLTVILMIIIIVILFKG